MTGFGRAQAELPGGGRAVAEVRSVNHRFLEVECRLPETLQPFEENVRTLTAGAMPRGQVRVSVSLKNGRQAGAVRFDERTARHYLKQLRGLRKRLGLSGEVTLSMLLGMPQVMTAAERDDSATAAVWKKIQGAIGRALAEAVRTREREGARLQKTLKTRLATFKELTAKIRKRVPEVQKALAGRLSQKIQTALQQAGPERAPEETIAREAALMVQSTDVTEELDRLESHLAALASAIEGRPGKSSPGRSLDFLAQEIHREVNTLGSKLRDGAVGGWIIEFKGQIEKLREQAANIE